MNNWMYRYISYMWGYLIEISRQGGAVYWENAGIFAGVEGVNFPDRISKPFNFLRSLQNLCSLPVCMVINLPFLIPQKYHGMCSRSFGGNVRCIIPPPSSRTTNAGKCGHLRVQTNCTFGHISIVAIWLWYEIHCIQ